MECRKELNAAKNRRRSSFCFWDPEPRASARAICSATSVDEWRAVAPGLKRWSRTALESKEHRAVVQECGDRRAAAATAPLGTLIGVIAAAVFLLIQCSARCHVRRLSASPFCRSATD